MALKVALLLVLASLVIAQGLEATDYDAPLGRFRVTLNDGEMIEGYDGSLTADGLAGDFVRETWDIIPRDSIQSLQRYAGTKSRSGAQTGFLVGLAFGSMVYIAAALDAKDNSSLEVDHTKAVIFVLGSTVSGGLIGAAIGSASPQWEEIPLAATIDLQRDAAEVRLAINLSF